MKSIFAGATGNNAELVRFVDSISRDKNIDKESVFIDLEAAMVSAARRAFDEAENIDVRIDRLTGEIDARVDDRPIDLKTLGRIAAQTAKQVMIQRIREDERNAIFEKFSSRVGEVVTAAVLRAEHGGLVISLDAVEAFLPRSEQIPGQTHQPGQRIRAMILDVRESPSQVKIVVTQTHPDYIRKLFELEVPEIAEKIIEIRALSREAGYRTKIAVSSIDSKVDAVGACVGVRGSRIRNIVEELGGEKIDIVRWNESSQILIGNALKPAEVKEIFLCFELGRATVVVNEDQLSLAIGKRGQNVRLASRLTQWDIDIRTPEEYNRGVEEMENVLKAIEGVQDVLLDKLLALGIISLADLVAVGAEPLVEELAITPELAETLVAKAEIGAAEAEKVKAAERKAAAEKAAAERAMPKPAESDAVEGAVPSSEPSVDLDSTDNASAGDDATAGADDHAAEAKMTNPQVVAAPAEDSHDAALAREAANDPGEQADRVEDAGRDMADETDLTQGDETAEP